MKTVEEVNPSEISFTERAAMRTQCRKLAKFMKVAESTLVLVYVNAMNERRNHGSDCNTCWVLNCCVLTFGVAGDFTAFFVCCLSFAYVIEYPDLGILQT